jgi:hypothetical protein
MPSILSPREKAEAATARARRAVAKACSAAESAQRARARLAAGTQERIDRAKALVEQSKRRLSPPD